MGWPGAHPEQNWAPRSLPKGFWRDEPPLPPCWELLRCLTWTCWINHSPLSVPCRNLKQPFGSTLAGKGFLQECLAVSLLLPAHSFSALPTAAATGNLLDFEDPGRSPLSSSTESPELDNSSSFGPSPSVNNNVLWVRTSQEHSAPVPGLLLGSPGSCGVAELLREASRGAPSSK